MKKYHFSQENPEFSSDWQLLYSEAFPPEERAPLDRLFEDLKSGTRALHTTRDEQGRLITFSLLFFGLEDFDWLSYLATDPELRSRGVGSDHVRSLMSLVERPLLVEIESPFEEGLDDQTTAIRKRRFDFYDRLGAKLLLETYLMPDFAGGEDLQGLLLLLGNKISYSIDELLRQIYGQIYCANQDQISGLLSKLLIYTS